MITLNQIKELLIKQENELDNALFEYFTQDNKVYDYVDYIKKRDKSIIEKLINEGRIEEAEFNIDEYKNRFNIDTTIYSMEGIINLQKGDLQKSLSLFELGLEIDPNNLDILYNIAYTYNLLNDIDKSIYYYKKCAMFTDDNNLIEEINNIIQDLNNKKRNENKTLIYIDIDEEDIIYDCIDYTKNYNLIKIINSDSNIDNESNKYKIYQYNNENFKSTIKSILLENENCIIITKDINYINNIKDLKYKCKVIYYTNENLYTDKNDYLNNSINLYLEKEACNICDIILTNNIKVYNFKKILENRKNVYLFNNSGIDMLDINHIIYNYRELQDEEVLKCIEVYSQSIKDDYEKAMYEICIKNLDIEDCLNYVEDIYKTYNTEEIYKIYLGMLSNISDYENIYNLMANSQYCDDIYKLEVKYLKSNDYNYLINFIANLSIKLYTNIDKDLADFTKYKFSNYKFELNMFKQSYDDYMELIQSKDELQESPLVIRNTSYLMYANGNKDYERFYEKYKECYKN